MVGQKMLEVLDERNFKIDELLVVASARSVGKTVTFRNTDYSVIGMEEAINKHPDIAIFSAGGGTSEKWAPEFAKNGTTVIDNSSAWRMDPSKKLIIPEINANELTKDDKIIANPNCSTIQMLMVLAPLHRKYGIKRVVVSTYQSVTGTGKLAIDQLNYEEDEASGRTSKQFSAGSIQSKAYPHQIYRNCLPHCDVFTDNGYTKEEMKLLNETRKILSDDSINLTATAVRVPVVGGHSESVNIEFTSGFDIEEIKILLATTSGVILQDKPEDNLYPMPMNAEGKDDVFVGRIRRDHSQSNSLNLWIVSDNLRKGAASNAVQIAEYLVKNKLVAF